MKYAAQAFRKDFDKGRASGALIVTTRGIEFSSKEGVTALPLDGVELSLGGAGERVVFVTHPDFPGLSIYTSDRSILKNPVLAGDQTLRENLDGIKRKHFFNWTVTVSVLAVILLLLAAPFIFMDEIARVVARVAPASVEREIGEKCLEQHRAEYAVMEDEEGMRALAETASVLTDHIHTDRGDFKLYVANDSTINAFALPGGLIIVNSGLIQATDTPEELLGVLAHETVHATEQHGIRTVISSSGIQLLVQTLFGDLGGVTGMLLDAGPLLLKQHYSRAFEDEADEKGFRLLVASGVDPRGMHAFFERMLEEEKKMLDGLGNEEAARLLKSTLSFLSTHPEMEERLETIETMIGQLPEQDLRQDATAPYQRLKTAVDEFVLAHEQGN